MGSSAGWKKKATVHNKRCLSALGCLYYCVTSLGLVVSPRLLGYW